MTERESLAKSEGKVDQRGYDWTQTYERWQGWEVKHDWHVSFPCIDQSAKFCLFLLLPLG